MTKLTCKSVGTVNQLTVNHNTRTYACAKSNDDEVLHTTSHAIYHLAYGCSISIVGKSYWNAETIREHLCQWNNTVASPIQIGCILHSTVIVVGVRGTYTHSLDFLNTAYLINN